MMKRQTLLQPLPPLPPPGLRSSKRPSATAPPLQAHPTPLRDTLRTRRPPLFGAQTTLSTTEKVGRGPWPCRLALPKGRPSNEPKHYYSPTPSPEQPPEKFGCKVPLRKSQRQQRKGLPQPQHFRRTEAQARTIVTPEQEEGRENAMRLPTGRNARSGGSNRINEKKNKIFLSLPGYKCCCGLKMQWEPIHSFPPLLLL